VHGPHQLLFAIVVRACLCLSSCDWPGMLTEYCQVLSLATDYVVGIPSCPQTKLRQACHFER
jgi:hypothetical protein